MFVGVIDFLFYFINLIFVKWCLCILFFILYNLFNSRGDAFASFYACIHLCKVDLILLFSFVYSSKLNLFCYFLFFIFLEVFFLNYVAGYVFFQFATCGGFKACTTKGLHFPLVHLSAKCWVIC